MVPNVFLPICWCEADAFSTDFASSLLSTVQPNDPDVPKPTERCFIQQYIHPTFLFFSDERLSFILYIAERFANSIKFPLAVFLFSTVLSYLQLLLMAFFKPTFHPFKFHHLSKRETEPRLIIPRVQSTAGQRDNRPAAALLTTHSSSGWSLSGREITPNPSQTAAARLVLNQACVTDRMPLSVSCCRLPRRLRP